MTTPLRSMTGFARVRRPLGDGELVVSVKSLNHRGLDIQVHAPAAADSFEAAIRAMVKSKVSRGHVEVRLSLPTDSGRGADAWNRGLLDEYVKAFREAAAAHSIEAEPDLNAAFRLPVMFNEGDESEPPAGAETALLDALTVALDELNVFRAREGATIAAEVRANNDRVASAAEQMERIRGGATAAFQTRLHERLRDLLKGAQIDPQRLAQEAAILADRSDINEELSRLKMLRSSPRWSTAAGKSEKSSIFCCRR